MLSLVVFTLRNLCGLCSVPSNTPTRPPDADASHGHSPNYIPKGHEPLKSKAKNVGPEKFIQIRLVLTCFRPFVFADGQVGHRGRGRQRKEEDGGGGTGCLRGLPTKQELLVPQILIQYVERSCLIMYVVVRSGLPNPLLGTKGVAYNQTPFFFTCIRCIVGGSGGR